MNPNETRTRKKNYVGEGKDFWASPIAKKTTSNGGSKSRTGSAFLDSLPSYKSSTRITDQEAAQLKNMRREIAKQEAQVNNERARKKKEERTKKLLEEAFNLGRKSTIHHGSGSSHGF